MWRSIAEGSQKEAGEEDGMSCNTVRLSDGSIAIVKMVQGKKLTDNDRKQLEDALAEFQREKDSPEYARKERQLQKQREWMARFAK